MALQFLTLENLKKLDNGKVNETFQRHLKRVVDDCHDRPGDSSPRKVTMEFLIVPVLDTDGTCDEVSGKVKIDSAIPKFRTRAYSFGARVNGSLVFSPDCPDNVRQGAMFDEEDDSPADRPRDDE